MNFNFDSPILPGGPLFNWLPMLWLAVVWSTTATIHIFFALAVLRDSLRVIEGHRRGPVLVSGGTWALATLLGGVMTAGIYWAVHHSTLRPGVAEDKPR